MNVDYIARDGPHTGKDTSRGKGKDTKTDERDK